VAPWARLQALIDDMDNVRLAQWEPALTLVGLLAAYKVLAIDDDRRIETDALLVRIAALDVAAMVDLIT